VRLDATANTPNIPGRLVFSAEDDTESQTFGGPFRSSSQGEMIIDETKLEKYIDNTMQGGLVLPERIKGVTLNVVSDSRVGSIGTSKYTTKHQSPSNTIIGKVNLDQVDMLSRNMS
jgi:hypothetical protein